MEVKQKTTVRFDALVKTSGQPEQVTLWTKPEQDRDFMAAVKGRRVVTVMQNNVGTKKDFGLVGFFPRKNAAFLVFPKALNKQDETKVIGIKYERLAEPALKGPLYQRTAPRPPGIPLRKSQSSRNEPKQKKAKPAKRLEPEPQLFVFRGTVELTMIEVQTIEVHARNLAEANRMIRNRADEAVFNPAKAEIHRAVGKVKKAGKNRGAARAPLG